MFSTAITNPAWKLKPSWYMVAKSGRIISPDLERMYAARAHSHTVEVGGASHSVYRSRASKKAKRRGAGAGATPKKKAPAGLAVGMIVRIRDHERTKYSHQLKPEETNTLKIRTIRTDLLHVHGNCRRTLVCEVGKDNSVRVKSR